MDILKICQTLNILWHLNFFLAQDYMGQKRHFSYSFITVLTNLCWGVSKLWVPKFQIYMYWLSKVSNWAQYGQYAELENLSGKVIEHIWGTFDPAVFKIMFGHLVHLRLLSKVWFWKCCFFYTCYSVIAKLLSVSPTTVRTKATFGI